MNYLSKEVMFNAAQQFSTPLYLYDAENIRAMYRSIREVAHSQLDIFFSMKANPLLGICQLLYSEGSCCEVCSESELYVALKAGFKPENIIFVGPGKTLRELQLCVENKIYAIVCESLTEVAFLDRLSFDMKYRIPVLLRVNPDFTADKAPLKMGGKPTQFGIDLQELKANEEYIIQCRHVYIRGIHVYNGTRILDADTIIKNTINILNLAEELSSIWFLNFDCIDIGGGFGIPYFSDEHDLDLQKIFHELNPVFSAYLHRHPKTRFILECGRYLVAKSGVLVGKALSIKESHGEMFIISDAGMNCHMAATGIASFVKRNFPVDTISKTLQDSQRKIKYNITGPLCTPGDVIASQVELPEVKTGDYVVLKNSGAYGPTASPTGFLSHGYPAEVLFDRNQFYLLRQRQSKQAILENQIGLENVFNQQGDKSCKILIN